VQDSGVTEDRKSHAKELVRRTTGRDVPDVLHELYVERRHTQEEIAEALGVHRMTVGLWLREYGITRDDRPPVEIPA
jgi:DNA-binding XRE family transcriptional regulator